MAESQAAADAINEEIRLIQGRSAMESFEINVAHSEIIQAKRSVVEGLKTELVAKPIEEVIFEGKIG
jgi:hypothetical protein